ncbi:MAG: T9SS type A sorting domain-containing protein [Candidatus Cloacimonetes bacterium]|nr:T9SS type A sorting domain-containing protein [Candidatus Cloacimonadota bacterium]
MGNIGQEERQTTIYYHNNSLDQLWYGTNRWAVKFDLRTIASVDSFTVETVSTYFPQAGNNYNILIYQDSIQPLDSLAVSINDISISAQGWNNFHIPTNFQVTGDIFWLVIEYDTNATSRYMAASATGGEHSYFWVPPDDPIPGYFANMAETNIVSELLISISGTMHFDGNDLELLSFDLTGNLNPGATVFPEFRVKNNSSSTVDDLVGINIQLHNPDPEMPSWNITYPLQLNLAAGADTLVTVTEPVYSYRLPGNHAQFNLQAELQYDGDLYPNNNLISYSFNIFPNNRDKYLIENFIRSDHQASMNIINDQQTLAADSLFFLNYFFHPDDQPYYSPDAALQKDYYRLSGYPFTVIEGKSNIAGYSAEYSDLVLDILADNFPKKTFISALSESVENTIDPNDLVIQVRFDMRNDSTFIFADNLANLKLFIALVEKNNPDIPGSHLIHLHRYQSAGALNLGFGYEESFFWGYSLQTIEPIYWEISVENFAHFDVVYWLQNSQKKDIYYLGKWGLDEFELVVSVDDDLYSEIVQPTMSLFPNPLTKNDLLMFHFEGTKSTQEINVKIYNIKGQLVKELSDKVQDSKTEMKWDGIAANGRDIGSGIYFVKADFHDFQGHRFSLYQKFVVLK